MIVSPCPITSKSSSSPLALIRTNLWVLHPLNTSLNALTEFLNVNRISFFIKYSVIFLENSSPNLSLTPVIKLLFASCSNNLLNDVIFFFTLINLLYCTRSTCTLLHFLRYLNFYYPCTTFPLYYVLNQS